MKKLLLVGAILAGAVTASQAGVSVNIRFGVPLPPSPVVIRYPVPVCPPQVVLPRPICRPPRVIVPCPPPRHYRYGCRRNYRGHGRDHYRHHSYDHHGHGHRR